MTTIITVHETSLDGKILQQQERRFEGKKRDAEIEKYLDFVHKSKMDAASIRAGLGPYTLGKITRKSNWSKVAFARDTTGGYRQLQNEIRTQLKIIITHED